MLAFLHRIGWLLAAGLVLVSCESLKRMRPAEESGLEAGLDTRGERGTGAAGESSIPDAPSFRDPGGDLNLQALTRMAVARSPAWAGAEGNLKVAQAQRRTVGEWEDPEFRGGFDWDDVRIPEVKVPGPGNDDAVRRNEQLATSVRFYPPNPFEIRAELDKSMAEISYAEYYLRQVGRDVVHEVRTLYQELQFLQEDIALGRAIYRLEREEYERLQRVLDEGNQLRDPVDRQRRRAIERQGITSSPEIKFQQVRAQLAALVGLEDPGRIKVEGVPNRRVLGFHEDTVASLTEMAFMNNLKLADLDRLKRLAEGDLRGFKAKKIPWVSFIETGRDRSYSSHLAINDTWSVRIAVNVPIFSLFSKESDVYREQIRSYQNQAERYRAQIERQIASAVSNIQEAREGLARFDRETAEIIGEFEEMEASLLEAVPQKQAEVAHARRVVAMERSRERLEAEEAYHEALLNLESIIRNDIEAVFRKEAAGSGKDA